MKYFDEVIEERFGIIHGKGNLIFIKTGKGGTIEGYEGKYLKICEALYERYGCSLVVSANPEESQCDLETEFNLIDSYVKEYDEIYYIGISNGASAGAQQCWKIDKIKNALLINGPLMVNWPRIKAGAEKFKGKQMCFTYGENDPSIRYIGLLKNIDNTACKYKIINGEGHNFSIPSLESEIFYFIRSTMDNELDWRFCVVGNIVKTHPDEEGITRYGTKAYTGGTKVYIDARGWFRRDYGKDWVCVIGQNRFGRYVIESVSLDLIENIRTSRVFKPKVLKIMDYEEAIEGWHWWGRTSKDRREAKEFVKIMAEQKSPQCQSDYERLKEKYKDDKFSLNLIEKWAKEEDTDWEEAERVLEDFS